MFRLAVHPLHNPAKLIQAYQPLIDLLNRQLSPSRFELMASRDYAHFEDKYHQRQPEFLLPNPWQSLQAMKAGYRVVAMAGVPEDFRGIFLIRRDSPVKEVSELRGKTISFPSHTALAACIMPQFFLHAKGIKVRTEIESHYVGSQESAIMNVFLKKTLVGATWPLPWRMFQREHPKEAEELKVLWETPPLINNAFMVRNDVPQALVGKVERILLTLDQTQPGRAALQDMDIARFIAASDSDYNVVRDYIARFEKEVRPVEQE